MKIRDLIKQLEDMLLIYGDRIILTITDIESEYSIKEIDGKMCAKYFEPSDHVAEVTIRIERNSNIKTLPSVTPKPEPCEDDKGCSNCMYSGRPTYKSPCSECRDNSQWEMKPISRSHENGVECEDAVSREQVLKLFSTHDGKYLYEAIQMLPSVTLKPDHSGDTTEMVEYDDCVSRQAVIDTARKVSSIFEGEYDTRTPYGVVLDVQDAVSKLPSVTPKRKTGKWIVYYECPKCGEITKDFTEYCPFCNADMRGSQNEPNKQTGTTRCHFQNRTNQRTMNYD